MKVTPWPKKPKFKKKKIIVKKFVDPALGQRESLPPMETTATLKKITILAAGGSNGYHAGSAQCLSHRPVTTIQAFASDLICNSIS